MRILKESSAAPMFVSTYFNIKLSKNSCKMAPVCSKRKLKISTKIKSNFKKMSNWPPHNDLLSRFLIKNVSNELKQLVNQSKCDPNAKGKDSCTEILKRQFEELIQEIKKNADAQLEILKKDSEKMLRKTVSQENIAKTEKEFEIVFKSIKTETEKEIIKVSKILETQLNENDVKQQLDKALKDIQKQSELLMDKCRKEVAQKLSEMTSDDNIEATKKEITKAFSLVQKETEKSVKSATQLIESTVKDLKKEIKKIK